MRFVYYTFLPQSSKKLIRKMKKTSILNVTEIYKVFNNAVNGKPCKLNYSDCKSQPYCGTSDFSVNVKKTVYNVYMNELNSNICKSVDNSITVLDNASDTTKNRLRCKLVQFTDTSLLKKCINAVITAKFATVE